MKFLAEAPRFDTIKNTSVDEVLPNGNKQKRMYIEGIFMQADIKNRNRRRYPRDILFRQVDEYTKNYINQNRAVSELGHPDEVTINPERVSHIITELRKEGSNIYGKARILDRMPMGNLAKILLEEGVKLGVSSRGMGSVDDESEEGTEIVKEDFFLGAIDLVHDPSAPEGFVHSIMEGKKFLIHEGQEYDNDKIKKTIASANRRNREEIALRLFENYLKEIR